MVSVSSIAQQILNENNYTLADISIVNLEYLIDNAVDYINLMAGTAIADLTGGIAGVADSGSTITTVDAERIEVDDYWNGYYIKYVSGNNANQYRLITNFDAATDTITHAAFTNNVVVGDKYVMGVSAGELPFKSLNGSENEIIVVKTLSTLMVRAYKDRGPNATVGGLSVITILADPQYALYSDMVKQGIAKLKGKQALALVVATDDADLL